mgnify:CR=1 FL=1
MPTFKKPRFNAQLPATPCTEEMRVRVVEIARRRGMSLAEVQRAALSFFLDRDGDDSDAIKRSEC